MANKPHQKLRLLHLLKLLIEKTDASNGLTTQQIIDELCCIDFDVERKALYRDIQALNQFGLIVEQYGSNKWHLPVCLLEPEELLALNDLVESAPFLSTETSNDILNKLWQLGSLKQQENLRNSTTTRAHAKTKNNEALKNLLILKQAIQLKQKIRFTPLTYCIENGSLSLRKEHPRIIIPIQIELMNGRYHLSALEDFHDQATENQVFSTYRIDRMTNVELLDSTASSLSGNESAADRDSTGLFTTSSHHASHSLTPVEQNEVPIVFEFDQQILDSVVDRFGADIPLYEKPGGWARTHVKESLDLGFYSWIMKHGSSMKMVFPTMAVEEIRLLIEQNSRTYKPELQTRKKQIEELIPSRQFAQLFKQLKDDLVEYIDSELDGKGFKNENDFSNVACDMIENHLRKQGIYDGMPRSEPCPLGVSNKLFYGSINREQYLTYGQIVGELIIALEPRNFAAAEARERFTDTALRYNKQKGMFFAFESLPAVRNWERGSAYRKCSLGSDFYYLLYSRPAERKALYLEGDSDFEYKLQPWMGTHEGSGDLKAIFKHWQRNAYRFL